MKKEIKTCLCFAGLLAVCMFTEPVMDRMDARAATVEPEPAPVIVEIQRVELPTEDERPTEAAQELQNNTPLSDEEYMVLLNTCEECKIAPSLALGLIAVSRSGCYGYCQLSPKYFPAGLSPSENIEQGIRYLAYQCERYKSTESGLDAYHNGHETGETVYPRLVMEAAEEWEETILLSPAMTRAISRMREPC